MGSEAFSNVDILLIVLSASVSGPTRAFANVWHRPEKSELVKNEHRIAVVVHVGLQPTLYFKIISLT